MIALFYLAATIAVVATAFAITRRNAVHALLWLVLSFLAVASVFYLYGAPLVALLEIVLYAGAILVLFVFAVMMLNLGPESVERERRWTPARTWIVPLGLAALLAAGMVTGVCTGAVPARAAHTVTVQDVGTMLFGPLVIGVQLAGLVLLVALVGAFRFARRADDRDAVEDDG